MLRPTLWEMFGAVFKEEAGSTGQDQLLTPEQLLFCDAFQGTMQQLLYSYSLPEEQRQVWLRQVLSSLKLLTSGLTVESTALNQMPSDYRNIVEVLQSFTRYISDDNMDEMV